MASTKKFAMIFGVSLIVNLFTTFVLQNLWNWFAVEALNAPHISYWVMYGLVMLLHLIFDKDSFATDEHFKRIMIVLDTCIPDDKKSGVREELKREDEAIFGKLGGMIIGNAFGSAFALLIGWAIHVFLA